MASGARAAASHTGQLAGEHRIWQAVARQARAVLVREAEELVDTLVAATALDGHESLGRRLAIVNGPGGPAVSASDACEEVGLCLAALGEQTTRELRELVAAAGTSVRNPVDIGMVILDATRIYGGVLRVALADPEVDAALVIGGDRRGPPSLLGDARRSFPEAREARSARALGRLRNRTPPAGTSPITEWHLHRAQSGRCGLMRASLCGDVEYLN